MNNDTTALMTEDGTMYLAEADPKTFPNINLMPSTAN
jgi:glutamine cyclotransferase